MNNAIVILYEGIAPSEGFVKELYTGVANALAFGAGDVKIIHLDSDSIAKAIINRVAVPTVPTIKIEKETKDPKDGIMSAVTFIKETFKDELSVGNGPAFIFRYGQRLAEAKAKCAFHTGYEDEEDLAMINATTIVCENAKYIVNKRLLSKGVVDAIMYLSKSV